MLVNIIEGIPGEILYENWGTINGGIPEKVSKRIPRKIAEKSLKNIRETPESDPCEVNEEISGDVPDAIPG